MHTAKECYLKQIAWCRHQTARIKKAVQQWETCLAVVAKEYGGIWSTFSAHQLLMIRPTVTFWHSLAYKRQCKWWTVCKNCFMACNAILFVSRLILKCFRRKFLHIFVNVCSLHKCFWADSFRPFGWIMHANVQDVFLRHLVYIVKKTNTVVFGVLLDVVFYDKF